MRSNLYQLLGLASVCNIDRKLLVALMAIALMADG